jgi:hypothetical protein
VQKSELASAIAVDSSYAILPPSLGAGGALTFPLRNFRIEPLALPRNLDWAVGLMLNLRQAQPELHVQAKVSRALSRGVIQFRNARSLSGTGMRGV